MCMCSRLASSLVARQICRGLSTVRVLDGGLSTQLENHHGVNLSDFPKLWTAGLLVDEIGCSKLRAAHEAFIHAGASIILSSSYQTNPDMDVATLRRSVELALSARDEADRPVEAWVSVGPYGATLADGSEYRGDYALGEEELGDVFLSHRDNKDVEN